MEEIKMAKVIETTAKLVQIGVTQHQGQNIPFLVFDVDGKQAHLPIDIKFYNKLVNEKMFAEGMTGNLVFKKGIFGAKFESFTPQA